MKQGIICRVSEPTERVNNLVYVCKSNGIPRLCLDPKDLNRAIIRWHSKILTMEGLAHKLSDAKYFSKLDVKNGYWLIKHDPESQLLITFNSSFRSCCFDKMPFGLVMSRELFQQKMDMILEKYTSTSGLIDDVIVYGKIKEEHDRYLHNLMKIS